jgi:hypothetical protein
MLVIEAVGGKPLKHADVNSPARNLFDSAVFLAQPLHRADPSADGAQGILLVNQAGCSFQVTRPYPLNEVGYVDARRASPFAGGVKAIQAALGFQNRLLGEKIGAYLGEIPPLGQFLQGIHSLSNPGIKIISTLPAQILLQNGHGRVKNRPDFANYFFPSAATPEKQQAGFAKGFIRPARKGKILQPHQLQVRVLFQLPVDDGVEGADHDLARYADHRGY